MAYSYIVYTTEKEVLKGTIEAHSGSIAEEILESAGYHILSLKEVRRRSILEEQFPRVFGVKQQDIIAFAEQLSIMIGAGLPLPSALQQIEEQSSSNAFREIIAGISRELRSGIAFSDALTQYPKVFPDVFCRIVKAGEQTGNLDEALMQAVNHMQRGTAITSEIKRVMIYPCFIIVLAIIVVALMMTVAMPPLMGLFTDLEADLPLPTRILMAITDFTSIYKFHILGTVFILFGSIFWYLKRPEGRLMLDRILLKIPVMKAVIIQTNMALFTRTTSALIKSGVPLPQVMAMTQKTAENRVIRQALRQVQEGIYEGQGLAKAMKKNKIFPSLLVRMVNAGELTGTLDSNLARLADYYEDEANKKIQAFMSLLEPVITVALGLGVAFIAVSLIMPMYSMMGSM